MSNRNFRLTAAAVGSVAFALLAGCGGGDNDDSRPLPDAIKTVMAKPVYRNAVWGLRVVDQESGEVVYNVDPNRNLLIASVRKSFSVGLTMDAIGADHRFRTPVHRRGAVDAGGGLDGDLIVVASGDMSMGGRVNPDGSYAITNLDHNEANGLADAELTAPDPLAGYKSLAAQIAARGIRHVRGDVIIDERLWDKFNFRTEFDVSPIFVNDDVVDVLIAPGVLGGPAVISSRPSSAAFSVQSTLTTTAAGTEPDIALTRPADSCVGIVCSGRLWGTVPLDFVGPLTGKVPVPRVFRITQPANYARTVLIEALTAAGVVVDAPVVAANAAARLPAATAYTADTRVAELVSAPYLDHARHIMKVSYNLGADTTLMHYGVAKGVRSQAAALAVEKKALVGDFALNPAEFDFVDGSGDGETRASTRAVVSLLRAMSKRPVAIDYLATFPRLGVDGSLGLVTGFTADPTLAGAKGQIAAKTGTYVGEAPQQRLAIRTENFAGYIVTKSGRKLVYHVVVNDMDPVAGFSDLVGVIQDLGVISAVIWRDN